MNNLDQYFADQLATRKQNGILRKLRISDPSLIDFSSNDYLGLARSEELRKRIESRTALLNLRNGATGSRLLSGNSRLAEELEYSLASVFKAQACLLFNSGYAANLGVLSSIPTRNDTILYDELCHASIKDGVRSSFAKKYAFRHNDTNDLEARIGRAVGRIFIVIESIYSMDGDACPLDEIVGLAGRYNCFVILDEAHSTGVMGENGAGLAVEQNLHEKIAVRIYTFGKAMGSHGACIAGSNKLIQYLINFSRPFIYTTALPDHTVIALQESFRFLKKNISLQSALNNKIDLYRNSLNTLNAPNSAIQTVRIGSIDHTRRKSEALRSKGFDVRPIFSPTVPAGTERLRICLHTFNSDSDIINLTKALVIE